MYPDRVFNAQRMLRASSDYHGPIDGDPGAASLEAARAAISRVVSSGARLGPELVNMEGWPPERVVIAAAQMMLAAMQLQPGPIDGRYGPQTDAAFEAWRGGTTRRELEEGRGIVPDFGTERDMRLTFGAPGNDLCTAGRVVVPWDMRLAWDATQRVRTITCHALVAESAQGVLHAAAERYSQADLDALGLNLFGGCYNLRRKRGGTSWSTHAWGVAMDFDPARNRLKWGADQARLAHEDAADWWAEWQAAGWHSLGLLRNFDWMHVQAPAP